MRTAHDTPEDDHAHATDLAAATPRLGFVGAGRVGTALAIAFARAGWPVTAIASRDPERRRRLQAALPGAAAFAEAAAVLDDADIVFLTVPDDAIAPVASGLRLYSGQALVHTSGLLPSDVLRPAMAAGALAATFHPLVAFADPERAVQDLQGATVALEGDEDLVRVLGGLAEAVGAEPVLISREGKAAYHAAATLAAGGLVALLDGIVEIAAGAGLDPPAALAVYGPLLRQSLANAERVGVTRALTGPVVRGDVGTLRAHLAALATLAPGVTTLYKVLAEREIALAEARHELPREVLEALQAALRK